MPSTTTPGALDLVGLNLSHKPRETRPTLSASPAPPPHLFTTPPFTSSFMLSSPLPPHSPLLMLSSSYFTYFYTIPNIYSLLCFRPHFSPLYYRFPLSSPYAFPSQCSSSYAFPSSSFTSSCAMSSPSLPCFYAVFSPFSSFSQLCAISSPSLTSLLCCHLSAPFLCILILCYLYPLLYNPLALSHPLLCCPLPHPHSMLSPPPPHPLNSILR